MYKSGLNQLRVILTGGTGGFILTTLLFGSFTPKHAIAVLVMLIIILALEFAEVFQS